MQGKTHHTAHLVYWSSLCQTDICWRDITCNEADPISMIESGRDVLVLTTDLEQSNLGTRLAKKERVLLHTQQSRTTHKVGFQMSVT